MPDGVGRPSATIAAEVVVVDGVLGVGVGGGIAAPDRVGGSEGTGYGGRRGEHP